MNALETNRQSVLNYKKQILAILEANYRDLSNNMKISGNTEATKSIDKSKVSVQYCIVLKGLQKIYR